jgi:hypothetical protein
LPQRRGGVRVHHGTRFAFMQETVVTTARRTKRVPAATDADIPQQAATMTSTDPSAAVPCADALEALALRHGDARALADECRRVARALDGRPGMQPLAEALCRAIHRMAALEEELLFPAARAALDAPAAVDMCALEHATARTIIRQLQRTEPGSPCYEALVMALADCVERHAQQEQQQLFPSLRASCLDLAALGERLSERPTADADNPPSRH